MNETVLSELKDRYVNGDLSLSEFEELVASVHRGDYAAHELDGECLVCGCRTDGYEISMIGVTAPCPGCDRERDATRLRKRGV